jgi:hypothetical protein
LVLNLDAAKRDSYPGSGTLWRDLSGNGNNGTLTNGPTYTGVSKDAAIVFDGVDDYAAKSNPLNFPVNSDLSVFSFFKKTGANSEPHQCIISTGHSSWNLLLLNQTTLTFNQAFIKTIISGSQILNDQWYYAGCIKDGNEYKLYLNGVINSSATDSVIFTVNNKYDISSDTGLSSTRNAYFKGLIPIIQVYNYALSPFDIFQNFNSLKSRYGIPDIVTDGLVLNLDAGNPYSYLQGSSGTTWTDVSGQGNNGTLTNGASYSNGAIVFDGADDFVDCGVDPSLDMNNLSFTLINIIKPNGSGERQLMSKGTYITGNYQYRLNNSNQLTWWMNGHTPFTDSYTDQSLANGVWYFVSMVYYLNNKIELYINGNLVKTTPISGSIGSNSQNFQVGAKLATEEFNGNISLAQVYNRALSAAEVLQNFNALKGRYGIA